MRPADTSTSKYMKREKGKRANSGINRTKKRMMSSRLNLYLIDTNIFNI